MHNDHTPMTAQRFLVHVLMVTIFIILAAFSGWLVWITYFKGWYQAGPGLAKKAVARQEMVTEPFHGIDNAVLAGLKSKSWCLRCHEDYAHSKSNETRAMLNAHAFFMACEVCHIPPAPGDRVEYKWLSRSDNSSPLAELKGKPGEYGGKIIPFKTENGVVRRLDENAAAVQRLDENWATVERAAAAGENLEDIQKRKALMLNTQIHDDLSKKPIFCDDCHKENGLLNFEQLLYSSQRAKTLTLSQSANVIKRYKEFYLPTLRETRGR